MIASMTKYSFILLSGEQEGLLEKLQEIGLVDITRSVKPVDDSTRAIASGVERLDALIQGLGKAEIPEGTTPRTVAGEDPVRTAESLLTQYKECSEAISAAQKDVRAKEAWGKFDMGVLRDLAEAGMPIHFHSVSTKSFNPEWEDALVVSQNKQNTLFVVAGPSDNLPGEIPTPSGDLSDAQQQLEGLLGRKKELEEYLLSAKEDVPQLQEMKRDALSELDLKLAGLAAVPAAENTIVTLVGYAPAEDDENVVKALDEYGVFYVKDAAEASDNPPISFRNNRFVRMFEVLTDMYGRPAYNGFDPTPFIAIFFLLFFAMCMGDAGYGLILIAAGLLLRKVPSFKSIAPLVTTLGVATVVVGFFFHTFFSIDISKWSVFEPVSFLFVPDEIAGYAGGMVVAIVIGIIHLCLAMTVKAVEAVKVNGFKQSLGTLGWTLLIVGGVIVGGLALAGVINSTVTKWIVIALGVISAIGIFPLNTWGRNPLVNTGLGLWDTYNTVTGLLGDVLSYLRLYALGLAGSMLGMAFNDMGKMVLGDGSNWIMWIPFILLVLVGHTLNIAMCALGAFVHPLRLNFLEFFKNSGYEAAGRVYNPLKKQ